MATVNPDDLFAVNRNDITYSVEQQNLMASLESTDYLAVNRNDVTYKITGQELLESVVDPLELTKPVLSVPVYIEEEVTVTATAIGGKQPYVYTYQWQISESDSGLNASDLPAETSETYTPTREQYTKYLACKVTVTDGLGTVVSDISDRELIDVDIQINRPTIISPADGAGMADSSYYPMTSAITGVETIDGTWQLIDPLPAWFNTYSWTDIAYGSPDGFVVVGDGLNGTAAVSAAGDETWALAEPTSSKGAWRAVEHGNGRYVAIGSGNYGSMWSITGINWTRTEPDNSNGGPAGTVNAWKALAFGNGYFVAVAGDSPDIMYSSNGMNWTRVPDPSYGLSVNERNSRWQGCTYGVGSDGVGRFVAVGILYDKRAMYSEDDGASWTLVEVPQRSWYDVAYGNGIFTAVSLDPGVIMYSYDGIEWTESNTGVNHDFSSVVFANGKFMAAGNTAATMSSVNGITWVAGPSAVGPTNYWYNIAYGNDKYIATSSVSLMTSTNGLGLVENKLTFADSATYDADTGEAKSTPISKTFTSGQGVTGELAGFGTANGTLMEDAVDNTMLVLPEDTVGSPFVSGMKVKNNSLITDATPDPALTMIGSEFMTTPSSDTGSPLLVHTATDWQVTLIADTGFTSPVASELSTTSLESWEPEGLEGSTEYRARIKYLSTDTQSEWSPEITFKTAPGDEINDIVAVPGYLYHYKNQSPVQDQFTCPELIVNWAVGPQVAALGESGLIYAGGDPAAAGGALTLSTQMNNMMSAEPAMDIWVQYGGSPTDVSTCAIGKNQKFYSIFDGGLNPDQGTTKFKRFHKLGGVTNGVILETTDSRLFYWNVGKLGNHVGVLSELNEVDFAFPDGATFKSVCGVVGNYDASGVLWLSDQGEIYYSNGDTGNIDKLKGLGVMEASETDLVSNLDLKKITHGTWPNMQNVVAMGTFNSSYDRYGGAWFRTATDELWVISGRLSPTGADTTTGPIKISDNALSGVMSSYQNTEKAYFYIDREGFAHDASQSFSPVKNTSAGAIFGPQGSGYGSHNTASTYNFVIVPA
jgi:hypothetical protein